MDSSALVDKQIDQGRTLFEALADRHAGDVDAAFWLWDADFEQWRLYISSKTARDEGPLASFSAILSVLDELDGVDIPLDTINAVGVDDDLVKAMEARVTSHATEIDRRYRGVMIGGEFVRDCLVYRHSFRDARSRLTFSPNSDETAIVYGPAADGSDPA